MSMFNSIDKVSIIIPSFNRFKYLLNTIKSIKEQTYTNIEIIVVNDTMLDFYIMRNSNKIISISPYTHGSGFSKWCSVIYDVPYIKIIVN